MSNITDISSYHCPVNGHVQIGLLFCTYFIGLLGNLLINVTLLQKGRHSVINKLLGMLAVWDSLFLGCLLGEMVAERWEDGWWSGLTKGQGYVWTSISCHVYRDWNDTSGKCQQLRDWKTADFYGTPFTTTTQNILYTAARIFQLTSVYQTIVIAAFRTITVKCPFQAERLTNRCRAVAATVVCVTVAVGVHIPSIMFIPMVQGEWACWYTIDSEFLKWSAQDYNDYHQCMQELGQSNFFFNTMDWATYFQGYHVIFYHIIMFLLLPFVVLFVLNIVMLREFLASSSSQPDELAQEENKALTRVVVAIVSVFLVTYIVKPFYVMDIFYFEGHMINSLTDISCTAYQIANFAVYILPTLNSVVNFPLYIGLRKSFRDQFRLMFAKCCRRQNQQHIVEHFELKK